MPSIQIVTVSCFGIEIGKIGLDINAHMTSFQYYPDILNRQVLSDDQRCEQYLRSMDPTQRA